MSTELNSSEKIKRNMEIAMEWMGYLDYRIRRVSVVDFTITLIADIYSIELSNKILDMAEEKGVSFNVERKGSNDFLYYTCSSIGLDIVFTD